MYNIGKVTKQKKIENKKFKKEVHNDIGYIKAVLPSKVSFFRKSTSKLGKIQLFGVFSRLI